MLAQDLHLQPLMHRAPMHSTDPSAQSQEQALTTLGMTPKQKEREKKKKISSQGTTFIIFY